MKTEFDIEELNLTVTNDVVRDKDGDVIFEEVTCESSVRLPKLELVKNENGKIECDHNAFAGCVG